jgi:predicted CoA-substrate-specific enzyme activase
MTTSLTTLGICLGASTVSIVRIEVMKGQSFDPDALAIKPDITQVEILAHDGNPQQALITLLQKIDLTQVDRIAATGRKFREFVNLTSINEPQAVELAYQYVKPTDQTCPAIVSAGGETFMVYVLNKLGQITNVKTGNKCASGTGEFFLQQLRRMDVTLVEAAKWAAEDDPYPVSGRCSVFCKSDCTHATNKGIPKSKVTAGLCRMMAAKILELLKKIALKDIMVVGGAASNQMMISYLGQSIADLIVPKEAPYFEALGAALWAGAHETAPMPSWDKLFIREKAIFGTLDPIKEANDLVQFKQLVRETVKAGDTCVLGLDVGSTTTKAVLLRKYDHALLASVYLRTNGDPVRAARNCYAHILAQIKDQIDPKKITIIGIGICGSGRQIAGLHAFSDGVINEIIAHATAAVYFDPQVDTIFEIGGQDAKYTFITNGVPSDYAMNEACSAGTGSFLEESAQETLGIKMEAIAEVALAGNHPPNFNDQCAAFIASDIKNAIHEGVKHADIVAGLVYSICMNYANRVKGNRPMGAKIFMQGGVCYNKAVPMAMANLTHKPIIVPPEPGLMGAFGAGLVISERMEAGLLTPSLFDLETLIKREVTYGKSFTCHGGKEKCDRRCRIATIQIEGQKYPFGGACNRYYNLRRKVHYDVGALDLVRVRQQLVFKKYATYKAKPDRPGAGKTVALSRSFLVNSYFPFYATFFSEMGFTPVLADKPSARGKDMRNAPFCYPVELAHGFFYTILEQSDRPDFIFLPHFKSIPSLNGNESSQVCPLVQGETFYLRTTFREKLAQLTEEGTKVLTPLLNVSKGLETAWSTLYPMARKMGIGRPIAKAAFQKALMRQQALLDEMKAIGEKALKELAKNPDQTGVVIFARPYNGFAEEAHMGIPNKIASRGVLVLPMDFISISDQKDKPHMYWGMGQVIMRTAQVIKKNPQLFGTYITNFSCGPDSFLISYFRDLMGRKPSLTLELDSHTADAGLETRIEAFLDIVSAYRQLESQKKITSPSKGFRPARTSFKNGAIKIMTSEGATLPITDPRVTVLFPSMGRFPGQAVAAVFRSTGTRTYAYAPADKEILRLGRGNTTCKECLPLILTSGTLIDYVNYRRRDDEVVVYFMPTGSGPCRFGQYYVFMQDLVKRLQFNNVTFLSLSSEDGYKGMSSEFTRKAWRAIVVADVFEDIRSMLLANAVEPDAANKQFEVQWQKMLIAIENGSFSGLEDQLIKTAAILARIPLKMPVDQVPVISLTGEIFVRRDPLSRQNLTQFLAKQGFATVCAPIAEWMHYTEYLQLKNISEYHTSKLEKLRVWIKQSVMLKDEKRIKKILSSSGLVQAEPIDVDAIVAHASDYISSNLAGEAVLTVGASMNEVVSHTCGVIAIGPFGCMPNRLSEAILTETMTKEDKLALVRNDPRLTAALTHVSDLPFLAIESDGSPFPQLLHAKLEAFCLQARRLHEQIRLSN